MVKLFFSYLRTQPGQNFWLFCTSELIRNPFWPKDLFMLPLLHTPTLQPHPKFGTTYGEASILTDMQNLHLLQYSITYTVTEYQNSIHGCYHTWSWNWIFEMGVSALLIGCWGGYKPEPLKSLHNLTCIRAFLISSPVQHHSHSHR